MRVLIKITCFLSGCFLVFILAIASNSQWFDKWLPYYPNPYRYGDLYLFSSLSGFKIPINTEKVALPNRTPCKDIALTLIGDSYTFEFNAGSFCAEQYKFIHWSEIPDTIPPLDHAKRNVLIIETTERNCRWILKGSNLFYIGNKSMLPENAEIKLGAEDNLQFILTSMDWELPIKELKTTIWLNWFDKFDNRVAKPAGRNRLYLEETVNPGSNSSGYNSISDDEINELVKCINRTCENAQSTGFDAVYISIIPNSASLYPASALPYNHLIERIQANPGLKVPFIDAYHLLKKQSGSVFCVNDTHWNDLGKTLWLTKVDSILNNEKW